MIAEVVRLALVVLVVLVVASCKGDERRTTPVMNVAAAAPASIAIPAGWVTFELSEERRSCASQARDEWRVAIAKGAVKITQGERHLPDGGPELPFAVPRLPGTEGRRQVLALGGGFLVGFDAGAPGAGALYWFTGDGRRQQKLGDENVRGLVALGSEAVMAIEGLDFGRSEGSVRWLERRRGAFVTTALTKLPDAPQGFVVTGASVYVLTTSTLVRIGRDRRISIVQPVRTSGLHPDSMEIDPSGALWVGMRQFVLRLTPEGGRFSETWLVRKDCRHAEPLDFDCVCRGG
jgi:hypothetical protein